MDGYANHGGTDAIVAVGSNNGVGLGCVGRNGDYVAGFSVRQPLIRNGSIGRQINAFAYTDCGRCCRGRYNWQRMHGNGNNSLGCATVAVVAGNGVVGVSKGRRYGWVPGSQV